MPNRRDIDAIASANFRVEIEGVTQGDFFSVEILDIQTEIIETKRGDDLIVRKVPGRHHYGNIVLRRRWTGNDDLWNWRKAVLDGRVERKAGSIIMSGATAANSDEVGRFNFFEGWPCGWQLGPWEGSADAPLVEKIEIAVEKIERG